MGHRALVAVESPDGRYTLYHDQWGGAALVEGRDPSDVVAGAVATGRRVGTDLGVSGVIDALDPREYEALFVRDAGGRTSAFVVVRLGIDLAAGTDDGAGTVGDSAAVLVPVRSGARARQVERVVRAAKERLGGAVDAGVLSGETAVTWLYAALESHPSVPEGTIPLPSDGRG